MKAVIVSLNSQYIHSSLSPWYLLSSAKKNCSEHIEIKVLEGTVNEDINDVLTRIVAERADVVAFSCYIWNISFVLQLTKKLKGTVIVVGGPEVSYCQDKVLNENKEIDFVISGEGEQPFAQLLNTLCNKGDLKAISGLSFRMKSGVLIGEPFVTNDLPDSPYTKEYFESLNGRIAYIETSRGCPFSCAFCLSGRCGGVRFFPLERAFNDILALANSGSKIIKFVDRTFNANRKRAREIWGFIIENCGTRIPNDVCFHFEIGGDLLSADDFKLLEAAPKGLIQFEIGMQSFNTKTLDSINRRTNIKKLKENIKTLISLGNIHIHIDLIAGLPFEDLKTFRKSFNTAFELDADMLQLGFLKLLHGADMRENTEKYPCEFLEVAPYEVTSTPWLSSENLQMIHSCENALERFVNSGRFTGTVDYIFNVQKRNPFDTLTELGMFTGMESCPLNEYINRLYAFFEKGSDCVVLRDLLLCDYAVNVKSSSLPSCLMREDKRLRKFRQYLEGNEQTKRKKAVMRKTFLLYSQNCGAFVDYDKKTDGKYILQKTDFKIENL